MRYLIVLLMFLSPYTLAVNLTLSCTAPTEREDGSALTGPVTIEYYKNGELIPGASGTQYSYDETDKTLVSLTVVATDENGLKSRHSEPFSINLSPPNPCSITVTTTTITTVQ